jgi:catechol 2,3-dioxygenase-like lactoylglutathione lyase family enzyme
MSDHPQLIDHVSIRVTNLENSKRFYAAALEPLGMTLIGESEQHAAFGIGHMPYLIISPADRVKGSVHLAFVAGERAQVDAFHAAALAAGGTDEGAPGLRDYHPSYYAAFVRDPDGHNIELVKHRPE